MFTLGTIQWFDSNIDFVQNTCEKIIALLPQTIEKVQKGMINIIAISDKEMIALNTQYRKKGYNTDILTFPYFTNFEECSSEEVAGEILLSESKIQSQAKEKNTSPEEEIQIL